MALKFDIKNSFYYTKSGNNLKKTTCHIPLDTSSLTATLNFKNSSGNLTSYTLSLVGLSFRKKMYQPSEVVASVKIVAATGYSWVSISKKEIEDMFVKKQVSLYDNDGVTESNGEDVIPDRNVVGLDFYVLEAQTCYKASSMVVTLKIYSPDKELTLKKDCQTFVSKKMGVQILKGIMPDMPYGSGKIAYDYDKMKVLAYLGSDKLVKEHIFPFLVQYNESAYDMLARTCNRWGEFLFYENQKLNIGYSFNDTTTSDNSANETIALSGLGFNSYTYIDLDEHTIGDNYDRSAKYDNNIIDNPYQKSPFKVEGILFSPGEKWDIMLVKKFAGFLKNDKNLPTYFVNELIDDLFALASKSSTVAINNSEFDDTYFTKNTTDTDPRQFGKYTFKDGEDEKDGFNPFSEISSKFVDSLYKKILTNEQNASKGAVSIDFDTTFPYLRLGQVIGVDSARYIVVQIDCKTVYVGETASYVYQVIATPQDSEKVKICIYDENDKDTDKNPKPKEKEVALFYPTILPTGHIRTADPQMATVTDADDPLGNGRVRVMFSWQNINKDDDDKITDKTKKASSPWIQYTANAGGQKGIMGMHYEDDKVFVGFVDGNVERPYVLGAVSKGASADIHCATPGGHVLKIEDDPAGFSKFFTGMFLPGWTTLSAFLPQMSKFPEGDNALKMGGGFELTDNYGFYKISGSSDGRNVSVASPWGDVKVSAFTGITITAPNGDVRISGKNVSIEAGNNLSLVSGKNVNYKLWREKKTAGGELQYVLLDVAAAVAKKLMEKLITIVDLSIIRNVVEIVFRPVEGSLTVKSNRYLKLEAGKNECSYPAEAYSDYRKESSYLKFEDKWNAKRSAGFYSIHNSNMGSNMEEIFQKIKPMVEALDQKYKTIYNRCVYLKGQLNARLDALNFYRNTNDGRPYTPANFNDLYDSLKADLWKAGKYEPLKEEKLQFSDEVKVGDDPASLVSDECVARVKPFLGGVPQEKERQTIVDRRKNCRKDVLDALNELRKEICKLLNLEFDASDINKKLSWFLGSAAPKDFKKKMNASFSRSHCKESRYYKFADDDDRKALDVEILPANKALSDQDRKYMQRVVALNLLDEFGFSHDDLRKKKPAVAPAQATLPPVPKTDPTAPGGTPAADNILKDDCWHDFINSLNGVPPLERDKSLLAGAFESAIGDAWDKINFWEGAVEKFSWGQGKNGQILFGDEGNTYALKSNGAKPVTPMWTKYSSLLEDGTDLSTQEKQLVKTFLDKIRNELNNNF